MLCMSIKILDSDCAINLLERMRSFNCIPFLSGYETMMSKDVHDELCNGNSFKGTPFLIYSLSDREMELFNQVSSYMLNIGKGERSTMVHALFLSKERTCEGSEKIIVLSNDNEANHIFRKILCKDPKIRRMFPNLEKIVWARTIDVIKKMWNEGLIDEDAAKNVYDELCGIIGPELKFLKP